jgi:hypothetical protein
MIQQSRSMTRSPSTNKVKPSRGKKVYQTHWA